MAALLKLNEMSSLLKTGAFLIREGFLIKGWVKLGQMEKRVGSGSAETVLIFMDAVSGKDSLYKSLGWNHQNINQTFVNI